TFEPIPARNTARSIYEYGLFCRTTTRPWEHDANGRTLKDVHDSGALFRAAHYDPAGAIRPLQILIRRIPPTHFRQSNRAQTVGEIRRRYGIEHRLPPARRLVPQEPGIVAGARPLKQVTADPGRLPELDH